MAISDEWVSRGYEYAKEAYATRGVDTEKAMERAKEIAISMQCWQGDDVVGFEGTRGGASGGIATTGNYPGRARNADELRADLDQAMALIPGRKKLSLHASYAELGGKKLDRDAYSADQFRNWMAWAKEKGIGLDFNPTFFSHPYADDGFTLASPSKKIRDFWIEHGKRCREIGNAFTRTLREPCVINFWMPDGYKDLPADTLSPRKRMVESLDAIFSDHEPDAALLIDTLESKLFGIGVESYTVGSHELMMGYALTRGKLCALDAGHFHPTEQISQKITAILQYFEQLMLHVSRGVRWDSDHVITLDDELQNIMNEIVYNDYTRRVYIALDYFDASINRVAAWVIGVRNAQKALLRALLTPRKAILEAEERMDYGVRLALMEESKSLPFSAVWDAYCQRQGVPVGEDWVPVMKAYEAGTLRRR